MSIDQRTQGQDGGRGLDAARVLPGDAAGDARLHDGVLHDDPGRAAGGRLPVPAVLQPAADRAQPAAVAPRHHVPLLRHIRIQLPVQHDVHVPLLPHAGGDVVPRPHRRLRHDVPLRVGPHDRIRLLRQPALPRTGVHHHARVRLGQEESLCQNELLRTIDIQRKLSAFYELYFLVNQALHCDVRLHISRGCCWASLCSWETQSQSTCWAWSLDMSTTFWR